MAARKTTYVCQFCGKVPTAANKPLRFDFEACAGASPTGWHRWVRRSTVRPPSHWHIGAQADTPGTDCDDCR